MAKSALQAKSSTRESLSTNLVQRVISFDILPRPVSIFQFLTTLTVVQMYVPPKTMVNKDFLRLILAEEKKLFKLSEVSFIQVPRNDELSVTNLYPKFKLDPQIMMYLPDRLPKGRLPDRDYLFNIVNTLYPDYTQALIRQANDNRHRASSRSDDMGIVKVSEEWWQRLIEVPYVSSKYHIIF